MNGWNVARALAVARLKSPELRPYIKSVLESSVMRNIILSMLNTTVQPTLNLKEIKILPVPMPRRPGVALALGDMAELFNRRIALLRQINTTLEAIAQALFKSWFVDFDPVHAKAEGRVPEAMDAATAALFPSEFEESELGPIPEGWRVDEIGNVVKCLGGGTPSTKEDGYWVDGKHHWATPKDLAGLQAPILTTTSRKVTDAGLSRISSGLLPRGTLLMSSRAPIGYLALAGIPTAINQGFIAMPPGGTLPPVYLFFWTGTNMDSIKQKANGSTFMEISKSAFRPIKLCAPSPELVDAFVAIASPLMDRIEANEHHRATLTELRDTLLPRLISGKLRLPETTEGVTEECVA
jgi:type I restriction enzyme S subunit